MSAHIAAAASGGAAAAGQPHLAIVGGGFSGTLLAVHLLRHARTPVAIDLYERHGWFGRGVAYATVNPSHLLNVRVANMSAFPDEPGHFQAWLCSRADRLPADLDPRAGLSFVPRGLYGSYLEETLHAGVREAAACVRLTLRAEAVEGLVHDRCGNSPGLTLALADGSRARYDRVVLCIGNLPPALPCRLDIAEGEPRLIGDPWHEPGLAEIDADDPVAILGTGLTAVDVILSLLDLGHRGRITAISRRGLWPSTHALAAPWPDFLADEPAPARIGLLLARLRREARMAQAAGCDWRAVVDAFRPHTERCWQALPQAERRRFLRHARAYWEVHRHRMAPPVAGRLNAALASGQVVRRAATLLGIGTRADGLALRVRDRADGIERELRAAFVINATGPELDPRRSDNPLVRSLAQAGLTRSDPLGLGLDVDANFRLIDAAGAPADRLYALGPIARGRSWEATAVPELRQHCARLGRTLAAAFADAR